MVYNNSFDKEKLLDTNNKSYCSAYIKYKCVQDGVWNWETYIACNDYKDKGYQEWDTKFEDKK